MRRPFAFGYFHICKCSLKWRIFRAAGIKTKLYFIICFIYMANSHLIEIDSIFRTLNTKIVQAPTESIPDGLDFCIFLVYLFAKSSVQMFCKGTQALSQKFKQAAGNKNKKNTEQKVKRIKGISFKMFSYMKPSFKKESLVA